MLSESERHKVTADITKFFSERACEATPKRRRECVGMAEKNLVRNGSERSEAAPLPGNEAKAAKLHVGRVAEGGKLLT